MHQGATGSASASSSLEPRSVGYPNSESQSDRKQPSSARIRPRPPPPPSIPNSWPPPPTRGGQESSLNSARRSS